jgi:hypothetical protein
MGRWQAGMVLAALLAGCSRGDPPPPGAGRGGAEPPVERAFVLTLESSSPSAPLPPGASPEQKAAVNFDHQVTRSSDELVVRQRSVGKAISVKDQATRAKLEALIAKIDWAKKKAEAAKETPPGGGRVVSVSIDRGAHATSFRTFRAEKDPELTELMAFIKTLSGYPKD